MDTPCTEHLIEQYYNHAVAVPEMYLEYPKTLPGEGIIA